MKLYFFLIQSFIFCYSSCALEIYPVKEILYGGMLQSLISVGDWEIRYKTIAPIVKIAPPLINDIMRVLLFPESKKDYKQYSHDRYNFFSMCKQELRSIIFSPLALLINGTSYPFLSVTYGIIDYGGARLQNYHSVIKNYSSVKAFCVKRVILLSGVNLRETELYREVKSTPYLTVEHFFGIVLQKGLVFYFFKKLIFPLLKKNKFFEKFDQKIQKHIQSPFQKIIKSILIDFPQKSFKEIRKYIQII